ncbi:sensor histidine kinase [Chitinophaga cymbidii]|nr:ATP-binding protein [Chitinophaga cymbidii]
MRKSLLPNLLLVCCYSTAAIAQLPETPAYSAVHYTDENGLPQNSVKFISPDKEGFLWLATENGLVRFDGSRFRSFNSSRIAYIYPDAERDELFARTDKREVISIHHSKAGWVHAPADSGNYEYFVYDDTSGTYPVVGLPNIFANTIKADRYLIPTDENACFHITRKGVSFARSREEQYFFPYPNCNPWTFFTLGGTLYHMPEKGRFVRFSRDTLQPVVITGDLAGSEEKDFELYWNYIAEQVFLRHEDKLYLLSAAGPALHTREVLNGFDFSGNNIVSVYYDAQLQRIFLGSLSKGLYVYTRKQFRPFVASGNLGNVFYAQAPYGDNGVLTPQGVAFDNAGREMRFPLLRRRGPLSQKYSLQEDGEGNFWSKDDNIVYKYDSTLTKLLWKWTFNGDDVTQLYIGTGNRLWIGTRRSGLYYLPAADTAPKPVLYSGDIKDASYLLHETPELLWVGTGKGLFRVHLPSGRITTVKAFMDTYVRSLLIPIPGEIWITTYDNGIFLYRRNKITAMPTDRKNYLNTTHCIIRDDRDFFWITTNKGLFQAARKDMLAYADGKHDHIYYHYYAKAHGFLTNEFNGGCQPCALRLQNGNISLPMLDGLLQYTPTAIHPDLPDKALFVDQVDVDTMALAAADTITLPNHFLRVGLHVTTPYFGDPHNLQMQYSMEGGENTAWLPVEENGTIYFSKMRSGTYKLRIRKFNGFGINNYSEKVITLVVETGWFETTWFRLLVACFIVLVIYLYIRLRMVRIQRKNRVLKYHVQERTRELEETLEFLQASERQLRRQGLMQQRLITAITHDIKTPMKYLLLLSGAEGKHDKKSVAMHDALYRMYHLVENLIQYMKMQAIENQDSLQYVDLHELLEEKAGIFRPIAEARAVKILNQAAPDIQVPVNRQLLAVVINNLLDNAVKYTVTGSVRIGACYKEGALSIQITDTGIGMEPAMRDWINRNQYVQPEEERLPYMQNGIGLMIVIELLQQINGRLVVHANEDAGTRMEVVLHLN